MRTLTVELGARSYPIHIGSGLLHNADLYRPHLRGGQLRSSKSGRPSRPETIKYTRHRRRHAKASRFWHRKTA